MKNAIKCVSILLPCLVGSSLMAQEIGQFDEINRMGAEWILLSETCRFTYPALSKARIHAQMKTDIVRITGFSMAHAENISDGMFELYDGIQKQMNLDKLRKADDGSPGHTQFCEQAGFEMSLAFRNELRKLTKANADTTKAKQ